MRTTPNYSNNKNWVSRIKIPRICFEILNRNSDSKFYSMSGEQALIEMWKEKQDMEEKNYYKQLKKRKRR